jgi:predicted DNA-binding protein YlxM (UPF0122 family)
MVAAGLVAFHTGVAMNTTAKPKKFSVCLTRQQLYAVRSALRLWHKDVSSPEITDEYRATVYDALQRVHAILLDAGGVDDTL